MKFIKYEELSSDKCIIIVIGSVLSNYVLLEMILFACGWKFLRDCSIQRAPWAGLFSRRDKDGSGIIFPARGVSIIKNITNIYMYITHIYYFIKFMKET